MNSILFYCLLLILVLAPLPLGSNREWSWTLLASVVGLVAMGWALLGLVQPKRVSAALPKTLLIMFVFVIAWVGLQMSVQTPVEWQHPLWAMTHEVLGKIGLSAAYVPGAISLAPQDSGTALLRLVTYGLVFYLGFQWCRSPHRAQQLLIWMATAGVVYALYGLAVYWSGSDSFLVFWTLDYRPAVRGTFVNRNSFATWLGLTMLCLMALLYQKTSLRRNPVYQVPQAAGASLEQFLSRAWLPLAGLIVLSAALILSQSRGGFISTALAAVVLLVALQHRHGGTSWRLRSVVLSALVVSGLVFFMTSELLLKRLDRSTADLAGRMQAYSLAADGIEDNSVLGFGYGTFASSFRLYRDESLTAFFDKAHNTYLENVFELGWPAALLLFAAVAGAAMMCWMGVVRRGRDWVYPATGLAAAVLVACHALVDFSLQMPATAVAFAALLGMGCAQSISSRREH